MCSGILTFLILILVFVSSSTTNADDKGIRPVNKLRSVKLPGCQACRLLVESFYSTLESIKQSSLEKLKTQENSLDEEAYSFQEIMNNICKEERAKDQCLALSEKCKNDLLKWWKKGKRDVQSLLNYLCIDNLRYCCPTGHYGPHCNPCPGYPNRICNNNGKCKGNGTRKGNGQCSCGVGYSGSLCDECAPSYYVSYKDENNLLCTRCHSACEDNCTQAGAKGCVLCRNGWRMDKRQGCVDINECFTKRLPCKRNEFCVNNEGSFSCLVCDSSCDTCIGDGPDMCDKCATGFSKKDNICVIEKNYISYSDVTRYLTYGGLCFATYIIFQNSLLAASIIGLFVAIYVTGSEYMLGNISASNLLPFSKVFEVLENLWKRE